MEFGLRGKRAIVCGGSRGLGFGCASALIGEGVDVVIAARGKDGAMAAAQKLNEMAGGNAQWVAADVTTPEGRASILSACPRPDILINNAGGPPPGDFRSWTREDWIAALDANMLCAIELIKATIDGMIEQRFGRIINITSHMVKEPNAFLGLSNGARSGLTGFSSGLARDVAPHGVTINNLLPGQFDTDRLRSNHERFARTTGADPGDVRERMVKQIPAGRFGNAAEFGATCAFLCSQHAGFITGQNVLLDGGQYRGVF